MSTGDNIKVFVRIKPTQNLTDTFVKSNDVNTITVTNPNNKKNLTGLANSSDKQNVSKKFEFDGIFDMSATQQIVYDTVAQPILKDILQGYNGTIVAYGQSGSGKTFSMIGNNDSKNYEQVGIIPRMLKDLFKDCDEIQIANPEIRFVIQCSYIQIYMEKIVDLMNPKLNNLKLKELQTNNKNDNKSKNCVFVENCTICRVRSEEDIVGILDQGNKNRYVLSTNLNELSSRSHSVLIINIIQTNDLTQTKKTSQLFLVDLAGSEQVNRSGATGIALEQAKHINKSLSALSNVINALSSSDDDTHQHIPYRDSKLTRLLSNSLGGNAKMSFILTIRPEEKSKWESYSTLLFGQRTKTVKNKAHVNEVKSEIYFKSLYEITCKQLLDITEQYNKLKEKYDQLNEAIVKTVAKSDEKNSDTIDTTENDDIHDDDIHDGGDDDIKINKKISDLLKVSKINFNDIYSMETQFSSLQHNENGTSSTASSTTTTPRPLLENLNLFQTGNMLLLGAEDMFTFESM